MTERNWAEHDRNMRDNPTLKDCFNLGVSHAGYNWSKRSWGHWNEQQTAEYIKGWNSYHGIPDRSN